MTTDNRTNGPTAEQILAALNAYSSKGLEIDGYDPVEEYPSLEMWGDRFASQMRAALVAAHGVTPPVNSFDTTAERVKTVADSLHAAPQEPSQNETKSGNNFVSLDREKVAALIESERDRAAAERDFAQESLGQFMAPALCEAAKRGELSA